MKPLLKKAKADRSTSASPVPERLEDILTPAEFDTLRNAGFQPIARQNISLHKGGSVDIVSGGGQVFAVLYLVALTAENAQEVTMLINAARARETKNAEVIGNPS